MTRKRVVAWAIHYENGPTVFSLIPVVSYADNPDCKIPYSVSELVEADPLQARKNGVLKASVAHFKANGSRTHSNDCDICLAVARLSKPKGKR